MAKLMLDEDGFADVTFELPSGKVLYGHRNVLAVGHIHLFFLITKFYARHEAPNSNKCLPN